MKYSELQKIHQKLITAEQRPISLRKQWPGSKAIIIDTLEEVVKYLDLKAEIKIEDKFQGMEIIYLTFGKYDSGLFEKVGKSYQPIIKEGGNLLYTQIYNGKIAVWRTEPWIQKIMQAKKPKKIGLYHPKEIAKDLIIKHIQKFLKSLVNWENQELVSKTIGYKVGK